MDWALKMPPEELALLELLLEAFLASSFEALSEDEALSLLLLALLSPLLLELSDTLPSPSPAEGALALLYAFSAYRAAIAATAIPTPAAASVALSAGALLWKWRAMTPPGTIGRCCVKDEERLELLTDDSPEPMEGALARIARLGRDAAVAQLCSSATSDSGAM